MCESEITIKEENIPHSWTLVTPRVTKTVVFKALSIFLSTFQDNGKRDRESSYCKNI